MARLLKRRERKEAAKEDFSGRLVTVSDPFGAASEAYRTLRTGLFYSLVDVPLKVVVVTSAGPREGKSTTCANLGVVLAQADKKTLLIDCDLRKPVAHKVFGLRNFRGVVNVLVGEHAVHEVWSEPLSNLKVVTSGPIPPNPAELLGSRRFAALLDQIRQEFDYVLIDAPPVEMVSDSSILSRQADGTLLVLDAQSTSRAALRQTIRSLDAVGVNILGTVLNNVEASRGGYYSGHAYK